MANSAQAAKRARQNLRRRDRNRSNRSRLRTRVKRFLKTVEEGADAGKLRSELSRTLSIVDRAVHGGILHPNTAARKKSNLTRRANRALGGK